MYCHDPMCLTSETAVLVTSAKMRHCDLLVLGDGSIVVTFGTSDPSTAEASKLLVFHAFSATNWTTVTVARSPIPFGVNETSGMPTGGLGMPALIDGVMSPRQPPPLVPSVHVAYWDVIGKRLILLANVLSKTPSTVVVAEGYQRNSSDAASNPGAWVQMARRPDSSIFDVVFFDLTEGAMMGATCNDEITSTNDVTRRTDTGTVTGSSSSSSSSTTSSTTSCTVPAKLDAVGHRDISDFGAGAFPSFRAGEGFARMVYFSQEAEETGAPQGGRWGSTVEVGSLKLLECAASACTGDDVSTLSKGKAGFGRDASWATTTTTRDGGDSSSGNEVMLVSFLDLHGVDSLDSMRAMLAVYTR